VRDSQLSLFPDLFPPEAVLVSIKSISKTFNGKSTPYVKNFKLDLHSSEITCLLGSNGSGKTTIINMLMGLTPMDNDDGDVIMSLSEEKRSVSLRNDPRDFKRYVRLCQQNDFLFDQLTVHEHLELICKLRGIVDRDDIEAEINQKVEEVGLTNDKHS
jgi:ATP-binding cassette subfamily A (ABC1) protein 3